MILYHGSNAIVEYPEIRKAKYNKDLLHTISGTSRTMGYEIWKKGIC